MNHCSEVSQILIPELAPHWPQAANTFTSLCKCHIHCVISYARVRRLTAHIALTSRRGWATKAVAGMIQLGRVPAVATGKDKGTALVLVLA